MIKFFENGDKEHLKLAEEVGTDIGYRVKKLENRMKRLEKRIENE